MGGRERGRERSPTRPFLIRRPIELSRSLSHPASLSRWQCFYSFRAALLLLLPKRKTAQPASVCMGVGKCLVGNDSCFPIRTDNEAGEERGGASCFMSKLNTAGQDASPLLVGASC